MVKSGVHESYFSIVDGRHDLLVESGVEPITEWLIAEPGLIAADALRAERDVATGQAQSSWVRIFRLPGQSWTQVFCPFRNTIGPFELAKSASNAFGTRCVLVDLSDEAWSGYLFLDRTTAREASMVCVGSEFQDFAEEFGMPIPEIDENDEETLYCPGDWFYSDLRIKSESPKHPLLGYNSDYEKDLHKLASELGFWVDAGGPVWDPACSVERMDLLHHA